MKRLILLVCCMLLAFAAWLGYVSSANAANRQFNEEECGGLAMTAGQVITARDNKIPLATILTELEKHFATKNPKSYVKSEDEAEMVRQLVRAVYASTATLKETKIIVYRACMGPKHTTI